MVSGRAKKQVLSEFFFWDNRIARCLRLDILAEATNTHGDNGIVLGVWLPGAASDLLASAAALPNADSFLIIN